MGSMSAEMKLKEKTFTWATTKNAVFGVDAMEIDDPHPCFPQSAMADSLPEFREYRPYYSHVQDNVMDEDTPMRDVEDQVHTIGLGSFRMIHILPTIMSFLPREDLAQLMRVSKDMYVQGLSILYRQVTWDVQDDMCNIMIMRFVNKPVPHHWIPRAVQPAVYVQHLHIHVTSPADAVTDFETDFRLGLLLNFLPNLVRLKRLSIADCRQFKEKDKFRHITHMDSLLDEVIWGEGTTNLETFEIVLGQDLFFFTCFLKQLFNNSDDSVHLEPPPRWQSGKVRKPSIKNLIIRGTYPTHTYCNSISSFEFQLAFLLSVLSPSLKSLTLVGLPKPAYLEGARDVGTGTWGGSVGVILDTLGPKWLYRLEELTIEGADTRYEAAELPIAAWLTERSIYVQPPSDEEIHRKLLKAEEVQLDSKTPEEQNVGKLNIAVLSQDRRRLLATLHHNKRNDEPQLHLNCDQSCTIHGSTSGTFTLSSKHQKSCQLHSNPLLRDQPMPRRFQRLHLINCSEPWPAFYTIACLHPPSTLHFSAPWMDASSTDVPDSLMGLGIPKSRLCGTGEARKAMGKTPVWPPFNLYSWITGADFASDGVTGTGHANRTRPSGTSRLQYRRLRKKLHAYMSIMQGVQLSQTIKLSHLAMANTVRIEMRCLDRISMNFLGDVVKLFPGIRVLGFSRLDGRDMEESVRGHVRGWARILARCNVLKEVRIVWNTFDPTDRNDDKNWDRPMRIGIGERRRGGQEITVGFSDAEWWDEDVENGNSAGSEDNRNNLMDLGNGEGPSTKPLLAPSEGSNTPFIATPFIHGLSAGKKFGYQAEYPVIEWQRAWKELPLFRAHLHRNPTILTEKDLDMKSPNIWTNTKRKEFILFVLVWKLEQTLNVSRPSQSIEYQPSKKIPSYTWPPNQLQKVPSSSYQFPQETGKLRDIPAASPSLSSDSHGNNRYSAADGGYRYNPLTFHHRTGSIPDIHYPFGPGYTSIYPIASADSHNSFVFMDIIRNAYNEKRQFLAEAVWGVIDTAINGGKLQRNEYRKRFFISDSMLNEGTGLPPVTPGIVFLNPGHNIYDDDFSDNADGEVLGPWGRAFHELVSEEPIELSPHDAVDYKRFFHQDRFTLVSQLQGFFKQINLWHEQYRLEKLLGKGIKRFVESAWVLFQEVKTLERVVGVLENGREVVASVVRTSGKQKQKGGGVELVKIRCWSCGGGFLEDFKKSEGKIGKGKVQYGGGARECRCEF